MKIKKDIIFNINWKPLIIIKVYHGRDQICYKAKRNTLFEVGDGEIVKETQLNIIKHCYYPVMFHGRSRL